MDEPRISSPRRDWPLLLLLIALACGFRIWQVANTEVPARDCIGYVQMAWKMEDGDWRQVVREGPHHPAYPFSVLVTSLAVRTWFHGSLPDMMQFSAQLASSIAGVLLVVPMFFLGRALFDRRVGFWSGLLFQCLPASGRVLGDGLSEALFFLFAAVALWLAVVAFDRRSPWWFAGVGLFGALAYLTRPEGGLLVAAAGVVLVAVQAFHSTRRPWRNVGLSGAALTAATLILAGPFVYHVGRLSPKYTATQVLNEVSENHPRPPAAAVQPAVFAVYWGGVIDQAGEHADQRTGWAVRAIFDELLKGFFYVLWLPALVALWLWRDRFRTVPGLWVMAVVCGTLLLLLYRVGVTMGYVAERHTLLILFCGVYWAAAGLLWMGERLLTVCGSRADVGAAVIVGLMCLAGATRTLEPLHGERTGFREAGYWLARHATPADDIDDPYAWSKYYAGRFFVEPHPHVKGTPHSLYVVVEESGNKHIRLQPGADMDTVHKLGEVIQTWPVRRGREKAEIVLYHVAW
jgi:hypothetical protein